MPDRFMWLRSCGVLAVTLLLSSAQAARPGADASSPEGQIEAHEAQGGLRYTIMVSRFEDKSQWSPPDASWSISNAWGELLTSSLASDGRFTVVGEVQDRIDARTEQEFSSSDWAQGGSKTAPQTGHMTGAQLLVRGTITHIAQNTGGAKAGVSIKGIRLGGGKDDAEVDITIYVVDSGTGMVLASKDVVGKSSKKGISLGDLPIGDGGGSVAWAKNDNVGKACANAIGEAVDFIAENLGTITWQGTVVIVRDGRIAINRGAREGVPEGQRFAVGTAEILRDPDTGEVLDYDLSPVGVLEVTEVRDKISYCKASGTSAPITTGMTVFVSD